MVFRRINCRQPAFWTSQGCPYQIGRDTRLAPSRGPATGTQLFRTSRSQASAATIKFQYPPGYGVTMSAVLSLLSWYAVVQLAGLVSWPIAWRLFAGLPDRGYCFTKHLGILLTGLALWLGNACGLLPNDRGGAWLSLAAVAVAGLLIVHGKYQPDRQGALDSLRWLRSHRKQMIWVEGVFAAAFLAWVLVRGCDPAIAHTEQPMDLMFLSAVHTSPTFPPRDAWLAGYPISYYYLGYWLLSTLAFLAGQTIEVAYNLGQASWFALLVLGCFGVGSNLAGLTCRQGGQQEIRAGWKWPAAGLLSAAAVAISGNLEFWLEWLNGKELARNFIAWLGVAGMPGTGGAPDEWWWWRSSRVLRDQDLAGRAIEIIDEFPFFSYLLGDNHPHLLSMPFLVLLMGIALNHIAAGGSEPNAGVRTATSSLARCVGVTPLSLSAMAVTLGGLALINSWDLLPGLLVLVSAFVVREMTRQKRAGPALCQTLVFVGLLGLSTLIIIWPFLVSAQSQVTGLRPNLFHPTRFAHFILMFGTLLPGVCVLLWSICRQYPTFLRDSLPSLLWVGCAAAVAFVIGITWAFTSAAGRNWLAEMALAPQSAGHMHEMARRWARGALTLLIVALCLAGALALLRTCTRRLAGPAVLFTLVLVIAGMSLICVTELCYLQDSFGTRMNTVFKFYYQAWLLLAVPAAVGCILALEAGRRGGRLASLGILALAAGMAYPGFALHSKTGGFRCRSLTLSGIAHWPQEELAAVRWLRAKVPQNAIVAEAAGTSYHADTNRMSAATGRSTLLGWRGHEAQWRGAEYQREAGRRERALELIFASARGRDLLELLRQWKIGFLYLGPVERAYYRITAERENELDEALHVVFSADPIKIYCPRVSPGETR